MINYISQNPLTAKAAKISNQRSQSSLNKDFRFATTLCSLRLRVTLSTVPNNHFPQGETGKGVTN